MSADDLVVVMSGEAFVPVLKFPVLIGQRSQGFSVLEQLVLRLWVVLLQVPSTWILSWCGLLVWGALLGLPSLLLSCLRTQSSCTYASSHSQCGRSQQATRNLSSPALCGSSWLLISARVRHGEGRAGDRTACLAAFWSS